jgi:phosphoserine aminotransferase
VTYSSLLPIDPSIQYFLDAANQLRSSKTLQFTRVIPGFFMDYWGMPHVRTNLKPMTFGVDMQSCEAVIPGDGNDVICMTYTYDMAVFIARLLEVEHWEEFSVVVGDEVTFNQLVEVGERIRGKFFFVSLYLSVFCRVCDANSIREEIQGGV